MCYIHVFTWSKYKIINLKIKGNRKEVESEHMDLGIMKHKSKNIIKYKRDRVFSKVAPVSTYCLTVIVNK